VAESIDFFSFFKERLNERNIKVPTAIQKLVIPRILSGENVLFRSATGTGKTFAYLLPLFEKLLALEHIPSPTILVVAPTLELCSQIKHEVDFLLKDYPQIKANLIIGSANISRQIDVLKKDKPHIVIGNPARLLQLTEMGKLKLNRVNTLVLDEGDRLISDELLGETQELIKKINKERQTISCSATMSDRNKEKLFPFFNGETVVLETEEQEILRERISHWALFSENRRKINTLSSFLFAVRAKKALVFTNISGQVRNIVSKLQHKGISVAGLYSGMDKKERKRSFDDFKSEKVNILVSSDLFARGLDISEINYVIALDVPYDPEIYIHRAGRTARAGKKGIMLTIGDEEELKRFAVLEKKLGIVVYPKILYQGKVCAPDMLV